ncbi:hypothetical protein LOTGIDRAFT_159254 [Lottia gigantea]|uniref:Peptidase S1 domain-containing protein n=1 Tax=Lottia gigantea TaxID=225164 RepID=V4AMS4_LOTGI|nr:hypothetical protein LOTGIDRAFT_159254 [Lottia gigantea]ESO98447.1 hypothetical protein LOTGIDRAFT_159254 [Lottia gigantea]
MVVHELYVLVVLLGIARAEEDLCGFRVIGGEPARSRVLSEQAVRCMWPWMVSVRKTEGKYLCPGVLIGRDKVITTARCIKALESLEGPTEVVVGEHNILVENDRNEEIIPVDNMLVHPEYDSYCVGNDIGVVKLSRDVEYNLCIVPACLSSIRPDPSCDNFLNECVIAGWGKYMATTPDRSPILRWAYTNMLGPNVCRAIYQYWDNSTLPENVFCLDKITSKRAACLGDEGGMVVCNIEGHWKLKGLISLATCDDNLPSLAVDISNSKIHNFITSQ